MREENLVKIQAAGVELTGDLQIPKGAKGIVLFAHGSGSGRMSPRNRFVANVLQEGHLGTLLIDLLTIKEEQLDEQTRELRFDIPLLAKRLVAIIDWLSSKKLNIGCFGASTGAAAALIAAAERKVEVGAVVSRGGRPDLAIQYLPQVEAPTLLIVGGDDAPVIEMNQTALDRLHCEKQMVIIPGATHLFEEPGALQEVARLALLWFQKYLHPE